MFFHPWHEWMRTPGTVAIAVNPKTIISIWCVRVCSTSRHEIFSTACKKKIMNSSNNDHNVKNNDVELQYF